MLLKDKHVILTGAGRGIGRAIACRLAEEGAQIALLSRTESELAETFEMISKTSPESFYFPVDLDDETAAEETFGRIVSRFSSVDILVNNAGIQPPIGSFHQNDFESWKKNIRVNLFASAFLSHLVIKVMIPQRKGKIINMSGGGSTGPRPNFSAYAVSKTAMVRFTENLAAELREFNIDVNAISPGAVNTRMLEEVLDAGHDAGSEWQDAMKRSETGGTEPSVAAGLIAFLASSLSDGITGKLISAPWDPWTETSFREELRMNKDLATLRRIDNKYYFQKK
ncbi:MAG: SDR family oxidoreductase [Bacteroidales bacterium]|nr:SDR family oxidoreductase [Bacteroidales bacterium]